VPVVIRGPGGVGRQLGAEHSQRLESYFQSIPGVQLVACSTVANAKALLKSAIRSDNPIIFFEHVLLYNVKGMLPENVLRRAHYIGVLLLGVTPRICSMSICFCMVSRPPPPVWGIRAEYRLEGPCHPVLTPLMLVLSLDWTRVAQGMVLYPPL
jgi:hypothetical protein